MSSSSAPAFISQLSSCRWFVAIALILTPQILWAQGSSEPPDQSDDPPPILYLPPIAAADAAPQDREGSFETFICRAGLDEATCAGELRLGERFSIEPADDGAMFSFALATHETVVLKTAGEVDTYAELFDSRGVRLAENDDGGRGGNFRIKRTLAPGRYYLAITSTAGTEGPYELRTALSARPSGNSCARATAISTFDTVSTLDTVCGAFDGPGDVDVYAVHMSREGNLLIDVDSPVNFELKAADCTSSLGLANSSLGATLAPLPQGSYYLYVSQQEETTHRYELRLEMR